MNKLTIEEQFLTLEQAKELKEIGITDDAPEKYKTW